MAGLPNEILAAFYFNKLEYCNVDRILLEKQISLLRDYKSQEEKEKQI